MQCTSFSELTSFFSSSRVFVSHNCKQSLTVCVYNKNLAIAKRSRVSCANNSSRGEGISVTLKSTLRVTQGHWKRNHWTDHTRLTVRRLIGRWILSWPWNVCQRSLKVIESGTIWKFGYGFLTFPTLTLTITITLTLNRVPTCPVGVKAWRSPLSGGR